MIRNVTTRSSAVKTVVDKVKACVPGATVAGCSFSGSNDEGFVGSVYVKDAAGNRAKLTVEVEDELDELFDDVVDEYAPSGWEIGGGYAGTIKINCATLSVEERGEARDDEDDDY